MLHQVIFMWKTYFEQNIKIGHQNEHKVFNLLQDIKGKYEIPYQEYVILLFSGGMDSTCLFDLIIQQWGCKVIPLYFVRNAKNEQWERESITYFYNLYKEKYPDHVMDLELINIEIPSRQNKDYLDRDRQEIMGLPLRNHIMWSNAFTQAVYLSGKYNHTIRTVISGSVKDDGDNPESGLFSILTYNLSMCASLGIWSYQLMAPLIDGTLSKIYTKKDLVQYAKENTIPLDKSRSCFSSKEEPCNICTACLNKNNAFFN